MDSPSIRLVGICRSVDDFTDNGQTLARPLRGIPGLVQRLGRLLSHRGGHLSILQR